MTAPGAVAEVVAEQREILAVARELARRELAPQALRLDGRLPGALETAWQQVCAIGFDRALLSEEQGGVGLDFDSLLLCLEEIAVGEGGVALLVLLANAALAALPPGRVAEVAEGERWALVPAPRGRISLGALGADGLVVIEDGVGPSLQVVGKGAPGLRIEACQDQLGLRAAAAARVSVDRFTAEPEAGTPGADSSLALLRAGSAAIARGVARRARELAFEYAASRVQGGVEIIEHDAVRSMLAGMTIREPVARPLPGGGSAPLVALKEKVAATEAAVATSTDAVQVFGGTGYMREAGVEKLMRDAKYLQLWPEPNWSAMKDLTGSG